MHSFVFIFIFLFVCFCGFVSALGVKCLKIWNDLWILVFFLVLWFWGLWFNYWFVVVRVIFGLRFDFCLFVCLFDFVGFFGVKIANFENGEMQYFKWIWLFTCFFIFCYYFFFFFFVVILVRKMGPLWFMAVIVMEKRLIYSVMC